MNCTFTGNLANNSGGGICNRGNSNPTLTNCIIWGNEAQDGPQIYLAIDSYASVNYSDVQGGEQDVYVGTGCTLIWDQGNIDTDPCFANPGYWDPNGTPQDANDDFWVEGDYHLKSQAGRWDAKAGRWMRDEVTSLCIDAGEPLSPIGLEPFPNGGVINVGTYGGTTAASKSYFGRPVCKTIIAGDINGDCKINFLDFRLMALHWQEIPTSLPLPPDEASNPNPPDGATDVSPTADLSWMAGSYATSHDIYFGTSNPPPFIRNQTSTTFDPGTMPIGYRHFWRIDELNVWGKTTGQVWSFRIPGPPQPPPP
jgi:parallel beta-helix repeat protein